MITGAEEIHTWEPYEGNVWVCRIAKFGLFGNYNPYTTYVYGDWYFAGRSKHTGCVYLNGKALYEAEQLWRPASRARSTNAPGSRRPLFTNGMPSRTGTRL